jgi:beta-phosphoglucomutase-like phosphatase (HAD superfamily)/choline kinase
MNIIIPAGGKGERFLKNGYNTPKPLIKIFGKPMILNLLDNLNLQDNDNIYIIYYNISKIELEDVILTKYNNVKLIELNYQTRGSAETILFGLNKIIEKTNNKKTIILDCDTFYTEDILSIYRDINSNAIFYTKNNDEKPIFSYISFDSNNIITEIKEKVKISDNANTGAYCFKDINELYNFCEIVIQNNITFNNEYYMSCVIYEMMKKLHIFKAIEIESKYVFNVGTPIQLNNYIDNTYIFLYDLDGTLIKSENIYYDIWKEILYEYNFELNTDIFTKFISGNNDKHVINMLIPEFKNNIYEISRKKDNLFLKNIDKIQIIPGAIEMLSLIKKLGHRIAIVTNCNREISENIIKYFNIQNLIEYIIIGNECFLPKPYPYPYLYAIEKFSSTNKKTIIFEDSKTGLLSAHGVSPKCIVGIETNYSKDELLKSFSNITMPDFLNFNINEIINYDFHENNILKNHILNSLIDLNVESIDIDDTKLKGGFISDVIAIKLYLKDSSILNCICKLENQNDNILSKMSKDLDLYNREYFFYKYISGKVPIKTPKFYNLIYDNEKNPIGVLLENINDDSHKLNLDLNYEDINVSLKVIDSIAKLHSHFWGKNLHDLKGIKKNNDKMFNPSWDDFIKSKWHIFKEKWFNILNTDQIEIANYIYRNFLSIQQNLSNKNLTFCHGDVKSANIFYQINDHSYSPVFIDWQYIILGKGVQDLVFFMIESFESKKMNSYKKIFKEYYYLKLINNGIEYLREDYEEDFVNASYYFPFFVAIWFGTLNEDELIDKNFPSEFIKRLFNFYII